MASHDQNQPPGRLRLLFQHFSETALLLLFEILLAAALNVIAPRVALPDGLIDWADRILKLSCIFTLLLFAVESLTLLLLGSIHEVLRAARAQKVSKAGG